MPDSSVVLIEQEAYLQDTVEVALSSAVQLEVGIEVLERLFDTGALCAADLRCLNQDSKLRVRDLCLRSCARRLQRISSRE